MASSEQRTVLITGVTGKQGGAVARHLAGKGFRLTGMTRKPQGEAARAVAALGVEIVEGDYDDPASLERVLRGMWGVFSVQNTWEAGVEREEEQGKRFARIARAQGVQHMVYTSVGSAHRKTGIPHFDNKARIEQTIRGLDFPAHVIIRPVFFMENLLTPWFLQGDKLVTSLKPETSLQMIAVDDIGKFGAMAFERAKELNRAEFDIAADAATMPRVA
ncbi:MAG: NmrA/HSCARG family protein, partial [Myxococcaceae bacterium]